MSDEDVNAFSEQQEKRKRKGKLCMMYRFFKEFLESWEEAREIVGVIPVDPLKTNVKEFVPAVSTFLMAPVFHSLPCIFIKLVR